jgi:hypothetical protein
MVYHQRQPGLHPSNFMENNTQVDMVYHQHVMNSFSWPFFYPLEEDPNEPSKRKILTY